MPLPDLSPKKGFSGCISIIIIIVWFISIPPSIIIITIVVVMILYLIKAIVEERKLIVEERKLEEESKKYFQNTSETYTNLILGISSFGNKNNIRSDFVNIIKSNNAIEAKTIILDKKVYFYKKILRSFGFINVIKQVCLRKIKISLRKINHLNYQRQAPIICLDESPSYEHKTYITGHCLLLINREIKTGGKLYESEICRRVKNKKSFYEVNKDPKLKLSFKFIEFFFYNKKILIMIENDFVVIEKDDYNINFRIERFEGIGIHLHNCPSNWRAAIIDLKIGFHLISILFFKEEEGKMIYDMLMKDN